MIGNYWSQYSETKLLFKKNYVNNTNSLLKLKC